MPGPRFPLLLRALVATVAAAAGAAHAQPGLVGEEGRAEPGPSRVLTLDDCLRQALEGGPEILQKRLDLAIAREKLWQAYSGFAPQVYFQPQVVSQTPLVDFEDDLGGIFGQIPSGLVGGGGFPGQGQSTNIPRATTPTITGFPSEIVTGGVLAQWPLFTGGRIANGVRLAHTNIELEHSLLRDVGHRTAYRVRQLYLGVLAGRATLKLLADMHVELEKIIADTKRLRARGFLTDADVLEAEAGLADLEAQQASAEANVVAALLGLKAMMALPAEAPLDVSGSLEELPRGEAPPELPLLVSSALSRRTDVHTRQVQLRLAEQQVWQERTGLPFVPTLALQLEGGVRGTRIPWVHTNWSMTYGPYYQVALVLKMPLFDGVMAAARVDEAKIRAHKAALGLEMTKALAGSEVHRFHAMVQARRRALASSDVVVKAREERFRVAERSFEAGALSRAEYLREHLAWVEARSRRIGSLYELHKAQLDLDAAAGALPRTADEVAPPLEVQP